MSVQSCNLTKSLVDRLSSPASGYSLHWDDRLKGFGLRITQNGVKAFILEKRIKGKKRRITLGRFGEMTVEQARKEAARLAADISTGGNPVATRKREQLLAKTLDEVYADYLLARKDLKPATINDMSRTLREVFPDWRDKPLSKITPDMVERRHRQYGERSEARANGAMRYLRAWFNFAAAKYQDDEGKPLIDYNPVKKLSQTKAWYRVERRQTVIKAHEIGAWIKAVLDLPNEDFRDYFLLVLLTGLRREEAFGLRWQNIDLIGKTLTVVDPKNRQDHTLPLSDYLLKLLQRRNGNATSEWVFADSRGRRVSNFRYSREQIEQASGVKFCIHDLRRTFATVAESLDIPAYALKRLLNHKNGADVTAGYIVADVERLRIPMQRITDFMINMATAEDTAPGYGAA